MTESNHDQIAMESDDDASLSMPRKASRRRSVLTFVVSALLLGGAGYFVFSGSGDFDEVQASLKSTPWWMLGLILLGPVGNHVSVAFCLHSLQSRHGRVGLLEMYVLVGSAWLLNYLPMRPGLIGRIGYHKAVNKIRLRDSLESSIWSGILAGIANGVLLVVAYIMTLIPGGWSVLLPGIPVALMFMVSFFIKGRWIRLMVRALAFRQIDVIVWLWRYWLVFHVLGLEISLAEIAFISAISQLTSLIPITGSGIGFREWAVGFTASASGHVMKTALAGDLINRAAETMIVFPVGLVCSAIVARKWKEHREMELSMISSGESQLDTSPEDESGPDTDQDDHARHAPQ